MDKVPAPQGPSRTALAGPALGSPLPPATTRGRAEIHGDRTCCYSIPVTFRRHALDTSFRTFRTDCGQCRAFQTPLDTEPNTNKPDSHRTVSRTPRCPDNCTLRALNPNPTVTRDCRSQTAPVHMAASPPPPLSRAAICMFAASSPLTDLHDRVPCLESDPLALLRISF